MAEQDAETFSYSNLAIGYWQIRILTIEPAKFGEPLHATLRVGDLLHGAEVRLAGDDAPIQYRALSYCWETGEESGTCEIICNGVRLSIAKGAFDALRSQRSLDKAVHLWIDAICIDQADDLEKNQQIPRMTSIYAEAEDVAIWLGEGDPLIRDVILCLNRVSSSMETSILKVYKRCHPEVVHQLYDGIEHGLKLPEAFLRGMRNLLGLRWFTRVWTKQEIWAARKATLFYQDVTCNWRDFSVDTVTRVLKPFSDLPQINAIIESFKQLMKRHQQADVTTLVKVQAHDSPNPHLDRDRECDVINVIRRCHGSQCSDARDHVYGLLGMTSVNIWSYDTDYHKRETLNVDYSGTHSPADTFQDLARYIIGRDNNLSILFLRGAFNKRPSTEPFKVQSLPSWVPDWRCHYGSLKWLTSEVATPLSTTYEYHDVFSPLLSVYGYRVGTFKDHISVHSELSSRDLPPETSNLDAISGLSHMRHGLLYFHPLLINSRTRIASEEASITPNHLSERLPTMKMVWIAPTKAKRGDIAIAVQGAYAPLLVRPTVTENGTASPQFSFIGPIVLLDQSKQLVITNDQLSHGQPHPPASSVYNGARVTDFLRCMLQERRNDLEKFIIV